MNTGTGMTWVIGCVAASLVCVASVSAASVLPSSDFDDGSLQGWTGLTPMGGVLCLATSGGNPDGYLLAIDTDQGQIKVRGPEVFGGDLSGYEGLTWDEFVFSREGQTNVYPAIPILWAPDGSQYRHYGSTGPLDVWRERHVSFTSTEWVQWYGPRSFEETLANCTLGFELDITTGTGLEVGLDNIRLVPEPSMGLLCLAGLVLVARRRRVA